MAKIQYVYIPFNADADGTSELAAAVDQWSKNVDEHARLRDRVAASIKNFEQLREHAERMEKPEFTRKIEEAERLLQAYREHPKKPVLLSHKPGTRVLEAGIKVQPAEYVLHIVGHCVPGRTFIASGQRAVREREELNAVALRERMRADGVPSSVGRIKLISCYGGQRGMNNEAAFADQFMPELLKLCPNLQNIKAYMEPILLSSFYEASGSGGVGRTFATLQPGTINLTGKGQLSTKSKRFFPCAICRGATAKFRCSECKTYLCGRHNTKHLNDDGSCPLALD